jgi:hypothetical protein
MPTTDGLLYARLETISRLGLDAGRAVPAVATALQDLAVVKSLQLIHGQERGLAMYWERGGTVRSDAEGNAWVLVPLAPDGANRRAVMHAALHSGRGSLMGGDTARRTRWWDLLLECGHRAERTVRYRPLPPAAVQRGGTQHRHGGDVLPPPGHARCGTCLTQVKP